MAATVRRSEFFLDVRSDAGFWNLPDAIGSYMIGLIMLAVVLTLIFTGFSGGKLTQMEQGLSTMAMQIQGLYSGSPSYTGLTNAVALKSGSVPRKLLKGDNLKTPWGGDITIATGTDTGTFTITLSDIKQEDCTKLCSYQLDMWESVQVNGTAFNSASGVTEAVNSCGTKNTIIYTSR
jgi:hypothetical protein